MPYASRRGVDGYEVYNVETGRTYSVHTTHLKARAKLRLLRGLDREWRPRKRRRKRK